MATHTITIIPGDGIGPEVTESGRRALAALDCDLVYEEQVAGLSSLDAGGLLLPLETHESILRSRVALKRPLTTPVGKDFTSLNVQLRKEFALCAHECKAIRRTAPTPSVRACKLA